MIYKLGGRDFRTEALAYVKQKFLNLQGGKILLMAIHTFMGTFHTAEKEGREREEGGEGEQQKARTCHANLQPHHAYAAAVS